MKRALCALLCAALLLALLPSATPSARMITGFTLSVNTLTPKVGDEVVVSVSGEAGAGPFSYAMIVEKGGAVVAADDAYTASPNRSYRFATAGIYLVLVHVFDQEDHTLFAKYSGAISVSLRPAPVIADVIALGGTSLRVSWPTVTGATGYEVWRGESRMGAYALAKTVYETTFTNTYLTPGKQYFYKVRAVNAVLGRNAPSSEFSAPRAGVPLNRAVITSIADSGPTSVKLAWNAVTGANAYRVQAAINAKGPWGDVLTTSATTAVKEGLLPDTAYFFRVQACRRIYRDNYFGPASGARSVRTPK